MSAIHTLAPSPATPRPGSGRTSARRAAMAGLLGLALATSACGARFSRATASQALNAGGGASGASGSGLAAGSASGSSAGASSGAGGATGSGSSAAGGASGASGSSSGAAAAGATGSAGGTGGAAGGTSAPGGGGKSTASSAGLGTCTGGSTTGISGKTVNIAYIIPRTGAAPVPPQTPQELQAYWNYLNSKGGVDGYTVQSTVLDTQSTTSGAQAATDQAASQDFAATALDRIFLDQKIDQVAQADGIPTLVTQDAPGYPLASDNWIFDIGVDQGAQGKTIADYFADVMKVHNVGVVFENDPTLAAGVNSFKAEAKAKGLNVVNDDQIDGTSSNQTGEAQTLALKKAQAVWLYVAPNNAIAIVNESGADGFSTKWFASAISWAFNLTLAAQTGGNYFANAQGFSLWPALNDPRAKATLEAHPPSNGATTANDIGVAGWGYGQIVSNAIAKAISEYKVLTRNSFRCAMQQLNLTAATSPTDGGPMDWAPVAFAPGVRDGVNEVITYKVDTNAVASLDEWGSLLDYAKGF
ncbi:MAG TPA: ABC transporter substrate-binding protein [Acidimicrobiales bacterium]|nr:ABC transporter substrate-binding protein [Acidimicrobiales bacterium]